VLRRADRLRRSVVPSLLGARQTNESLSNPRIELFETAHVYLPLGKDALPAEEQVIAITSGGDYLHVKGVIEGLLAVLDPAAELEAAPTKQPLLDDNRSAELYVRRANGQRVLLGYLGEVRPTGLKSFDLRGGTTVAELKLQTLVDVAELVPQYRQPPVFPAVTRDLNLVVDESVLWADVAQTVREAAAPFAERLDLEDVYRDASRLGAGKKSLLFSLTLRSATGTLTGEEADAAQQRVITACSDKHQAQLRA
jgi:phenylalanyl-tRNA synthetase beta chain